MTLDEYREALKQAISDSIEKRWRLLSKDPYNCVIDCTLCDLSYTIRYASTNKCDFCPMPQLPDYCSKAYKKWIKAKSKRGEISAALQIISELETIDIDAWCKHLKEIGVFD